MNSSPPRRAGFFPSSKATGSSTLQLTWLKLWAKINASSFEAAHLGPCHADGAVSREKSMGEGAHTLLLPQWGLRRTTSETKVGWAISCFTRLWRQVINLTIVVLSLTGRWGFAVLGSQLHQQSRREWDGLEPRLTLRDEWAVASLALGLFFRVAPGLHFQLITVTGWSPVSQRRYCSFWSWKVISKGEGKGVTSPTERERNLCKGNVEYTKDDGS